MSLRCLAAAEAAGIAITMLPTLYCHGGFGGQAPADGQRRFVNDVGRFAAILDELDKAVRANPRARLGIAPHSLRAVTGEALGGALAGHRWLRPGAPVHIHVAEQTREVDDCVAFCGKRPVELLMSLFELSARWCLIHATHMNEEETAALAEAGPLRVSVPRPRPISATASSTAAPFLGGGRRHCARVRQPHLREPGGGNPPARIFAAPSPSRAATCWRAAPTARPAGGSMMRPLAGGAAALAQPQGSIAPGMRADIVVLDERASGAHRPQRRRACSIPGSSPAAMLA